MTNISVELTSFVGRTRELAQLALALRETRMVTLTGPGGCGKTRLARALALRVAGRFSSGIWQVELAGLDRAGLVPQAIAQALRVAEPPDRPVLAALAERLRASELLLLLDNCEHLLADCAAVVDPLLRGCPNLRVVATSRSPLGIEGELAWPVPPLGVPGAHIPTTAAGLATVESVRLFCDRARLASPGLALTDENAAAVRAICEAVDGLPLAIELAAARARALTPAQIAERLRDRFALLRGGPSPVPRHRTLRATLDWSHDLLGEAEREAWARLSVFAGGWELEAAEDVCSGDAVKADAVFELLASLVDKSIVAAADRGGRMRYQMLETIRAYGRERLREAGEELATRERHLAWFVRLAARAAREWRGPQQSVWLDRADEEIDNVRAALEWARSEPSHVASGLALASDLWLYWLARGHAAEGRHWLAELLAAGAAPARVRGQALNAAGFLAYASGDSAAAMPLLEEAVRFAENIEDPSALVFANMRLGIGAYYDGDLERACALLEDALLRYRRLDDETGTYVALYELAEVVGYRGDHDRSLTLHRESLELKERRGDRWHIAFSLFGMGLLEWLTDDCAEATQLAGRALRIRRDLDDHWGVAQAVELLAWIASSQRRFRRAAALLGAADALFASIGVRLPRNYRPSHEGSAAAALTALGDAFQAANEEGRGLSVDAAVAFALSEDERPASGPRKTAVEAGALSARERQVAVLIARGLTNREIAADLFIAERTVDAHVAHILDKLEVRSRAQVAVWVAAEEARAGGARPHSAAE